MNREGYETQGWQEEYTERTKVGNKLHSRERDI